MSSQEHEDHPVAHDHVSPVGQIIKFVLLAAVLIGAVVVVNLSRPLIFGEIVPAVIGIDPPTTPVVDPGGDPGPTATPDPGAEPTATPEPVATETAVPPTPEPFTHTVAAGENLTRIANTYGITVAALMDANDITDPNRVYVGDVLVIPPPEE